jgi:hypothetical protein
VVNLSGGSVGNGVEIFSLGTLNFTGGTVGTDFDVRSGGAVNLFGTQFILDGIDITNITNSLTLDAAFTITDRDVTLSGLLDDGSPFSFDLNSVNVAGMDFFDPAALLNITLTKLAGDLNGDGFVGIADLNIVLGNWNAGTPPTASTANIPEPGTVSLLGLASLLVTVRRGCRSNG